MHCHHKNCHMIDDRVCPILNAAFNDKYKHKFIFIHIPKTAGNSIDTLFWKV